jgi:hypothetical protein
MSSRTEKKMPRKMPALQGPLKIWATRDDWRFYRWGDQLRYTHPRAIAVKLNERGAQAQECGRLMRNHAWSSGTWYILPAEKVAKLRPVWVAGFRRCPTDYECENNQVLTTEQLLELEVNC